MFNNMIPELLFAVKLFKNFCLHILNPYDIIKKNKGGIVDEESYLPTA